MGALPAESCALSESQPIPQTQLLPGSALSQREIAAEYAVDKAFFVSRGIDATFVSKLFESPPDTFWYPNYDELLSSRFVTGRPRNDDVALSGGIPPDPSQLEAELLRNPLYAALKEVAPSNYDVVRDAIVSGVQRGRSLADVRAETLPVIRSLIEERLPRSSDRALLMFSSLLVKQFEHLSRVDPVGCYDSAFGTSNALPDLTPELQNEEFVASAEVIESYTQAMRIPSDQAVESSLELVMVPLVRKYGDALALFEKQPLSDSEKAVVCGMTIEMYSEINRLPQQRAVALLRNLFSK
jgi:hypothetical protein